MGNGAGAGCWGGRTGSTRPGGSQQQPGRPLRVRRGGPEARWAREEVGAGIEGWRHFGVCWAGGLLLHLPRLLAPLLHISTFHASPPRMPNLAHAICRLSSEIGIGTKAECITSPPLPLHEERRRGRDRGLGGKRPTSTFFPVFLLTLPPQSQVLGASGSSQAGPRGRTRALISEIPGQGRRSGHVAVPLAR